MAVMLNLLADSCLTTSRHNFSFQSSPSRQGNPAAIEGGRRTAKEVRKGEKGQEDVDSNGLLRGRVCGHCLGLQSQVNNDHSACRKAGTFASAEGYTGGRVETTGYSDSGAE